VFFDQLHEEVILIRGSPPREVFLSNKATSAWYSFKINLDDNPNILDACFSADLTLLALRTSDKEVRIIDCLLGKVVETRSCRETSASMLAVHWISNHTPDPYLAAAHAAAVARAYKAAQENGVHRASVAGVDAMGATSPSQQQSESPQGASQATTPTSNPYLQLETNRTPQDILVVTSAGIELQRLEKSKLRWVRTFATEVIDHWIIHEQKMLLTLGNASEFLLFRVDPKSASPLTKVTRFDLGVMNRQWQTLTSPAPGASVPEEEDDLGGIESGTDHGVVTESGETIAVGVGLASGGMTHGRGNVAIGRSRQDRCRLSTVVLYGKLYLALVDENNNKLYLLALNAEGDSFEQVMTLNLGLSGRFVVLAVDNILVAIALRDRIALLFDVRSRRPDPIAPPLGLGFSTEVYNKFKLVDPDTAGAKVSQGRPSSASQAKRLPLELHNNWIFHGPRYLINTSSSGKAGAIYSIELHLAALAANWPSSKQVRLVDLLLKRTGVRSKLIVMRVIRSVIALGGPPAIPLISRLFAVFAGFLLESPTEVPLAPSELALLADCIPGSKAIQALAHQQRLKVDGLIRATSAHPALHPEEFLQRKLLSAGISSPTEAKSSATVSSTQPSAEVNVDHYVLNESGTLSKTGPSRSQIADQKDLDMGGEGSPRTDSNSDPKDTPIETSAPESTPANGPSYIGSEPTALVTTMAQSELGSQSARTAASASMSEGDLLPPPIPLTLPLPPIMESIGESFATPLFCLYAPSGHHIVTQSDLYFHVLVPLFRGYLQRPHAEMSLEVESDFDPENQPPSGLERIRVPAQDLILVIVEFVRALARHKLKVDPMINELLFAAILAAGKYVALHMFLQYHIISDSPLIAERLIELSTTYAPAFQLGLDMLYRLNASPRVLQIHLQQGLITQALQLVVPLSNTFTQPNVQPKDFLNAALRSRNKITFYSAYRYFEQRNLLLHGSPSFIPSDGCGFAVRAFERLHSEPFDKIVDDLLREVGEL